MLHIKDLAKDESSVHNCEKQECQAFVLQVICSTNMISANAGVSCKKEEESQATTRPIAFHLPFGYVFGRGSVFKIV